MYAIYLRSRKEPIVVDNDFGRNLQSQWAEGMVPKKLVIEDIAFESQAIRAIEANYTAEEAAKVTEREMDTNVKWMREEFDALEKHNEAAKKTPIEHRAANLNVAQFYHYGITGKWIPEELKEKIIERQYEYLTKYPDEVYANPDCFKDLVRYVEEDVKNTRVGTAMHISSALRIHAINLSEKILLSSFK